MGIGFAKLLLSNLKKRYPNGGTGVEERAVGNYIDPCWKGIHLNKHLVLLSTKQMIKERWSHLEGQPIRAIRGEQAGAPLSPNSLLLQEVGGLDEQSNMDSSDMLAKEMVRFEALPRLPIGGDCLTWWKQHAESLPLLSKIAREILCIPAASSKSERVFSIGTQVLEV